jgi:uracil-DNA glycosylase family 4
MNLHVIRSQWTRCTGCTLSTTRLLQEAYDTRCDLNDVKRVALDLVKQRRPELFITEDTKPTVIEEIQKLMTNFVAWKEKNPESTAGVVFGSGSLKADFVIVKGAPTAEEVRMGATLSGDDGNLIEELLMEAGIDPIKDVYRTPVVGCRPYVVLPATDDVEEQLQDRPPSKEEKSACSKRLQQIIYNVDPRIIITMGGEAWTSVVTAKDRQPFKKITAAAGKLFEAWIPGVFQQVRYPVLVTESPEKLLANPSTAAHGPINMTLKYFTLAKKYVEFQKRAEE